MILLSGHSRVPVCKVPLEALSLSLKERDSTATMTPADMSGIGLDSWFLDDTNPGAGIVWRVRSIQTAFATDTPTVQLEHAICTLKDRILFGEVTAETISGGSTCTAEQAVRYILGKQSDWRLGNFGYNISGPYKFDGDTLFDAIQHVTESLDGAWWSYDMSSYPFTLHIMPKAAGVACELRPGRNLNTVTKVVDKSTMYTRFYPIGKDDLHISTEYVSRNENLYGVISKVEVDTSRESEAELRTWANERLRKHADPVVTVSVEGMELADATGESLDRLTLGRICRIPLAEFGTTIEEYITEIRYRDKVHNPERVTVTLSNKQDDVRMDVATVIAEAIKAGGGGSGRGGRSGARQQKEDHAWFEDTDDHVAMCAVGIIGKDANGNPNWLRLSRLEVGEYGIAGEVQSVQNDIVVANTRIDQTEDHITLEANRAVDAENTLSGKITVQADRITQEVSRATSAEGTLSGRITVEADRITQEVTRATTAEGTLSGRITTTAEAVTAEVTRATAAEGTLSGNITVQAGKINQIVSAVGSDGQVTAASICLAINNGGSSATINADKIYLLGQTIANQITADYIRTKVAAIPRVTMIDAYATSFSVGSSILLSNGLYLDANAVWQVGISQSGNTYTLTETKLNGTERTIGSFSRATTLSGTWSGGTFTVSASPQGNTITSGIFDLTSNDISWSGNTATCTVYANLNGGETKYNTGKTLTVDASARYTAGYNSGKTDYRPDNIRIDGQNVYVLNSEGDDVGGPYSCSSIYNSGRNSVSISSIEVYGDPAATATSISVKATASNGASDIGSISITSQRNNAYNSGYSDANNQYTHRYTGTLYTNGTISAGNGSWYTKSS